MNRNRRLISRTLRNVLWSLAIIAAALFVGTVGYHYFGNDPVNGEVMSWTLALDNAAMILAGEGPLGGLHTPAGQVFESAYALICGFLFFAIAGFALSPALHHVLRGFHLEDEERK